MKHAYRVMLAALGIVACWGAPATGPLRVSRENPRYFADPSGAIVYVTGLHTWANLQDQAAKEPVPKFDFEHYLDELERYHHNFIRLWVWEQARWAPWSDGKGTNPKDWYIEPNPYARSGPGLALDGKAKFDLERFDNAYFERLRERVKKAGDRGIYVSIMLFQGGVRPKVGWEESRGMGIPIIRTITFSGLTEIRAGIPGRAWMQKPCASTRRNICAK